MRLHVGDHVGAAARAQRCASATTVANRPHKPRFGSSNTADSPCQFRVPPMRPLPSGTTRTCHDKLVRDLRDATPKRPAARQRSPPPRSHWMRDQGVVDSNRGPATIRGSRRTTASRRTCATNRHNPGSVPEGFGPDQQQTRQSRPRDWPAVGTSFTGCPMPVYAAAARGIKARARRVPAPMAQSGNPWSCPPGRRPVRRHCGPASRTSRCIWRLRRSAARPCSGSNCSPRTLFLIRARRATFADDSTNLAPTTPGATSLTRLRSAGRSRYGTPPAKAASGSSLLLVVTISAAYRTSPATRSSAQRPPLVRDDDDVSVLLDCSSRHRSTP